MANNDIEKFEVFGDGKKGTLLTRHKIFLQAIGHVLVWLGKAFIHADTYERVEQICREMDEKGKRMKELGEKLDELSDEEVKKLAETIKDGG